MHSVNQIDTLKSTLRNNRLGTNGQLLRRLEDEAHTAVELILHADENLCRTQQHGGMGVMSAGVHETRIFGLEGHIGFSVMERASISARSAMRFQDRHP